MASIDITFVERLVFFKWRASTVFITDEEGHRLMKSYGMVEQRVHWTVSSCNKQYCSEHTRLSYDHTRVSSVFLGCMKQVTVDAGNDWRRSADENVGRWMLADQVNHMYWIPVKENPNRVIPTRPLRMERVDTQWPAQERPWPIKGQTYEEWKEDTIARVMGVLVKHL